MLIENQFTVAAPADDLWRYLLDVERIAPCMPGAELTDVVDDRNWKGTVHAKFGPVSHVVRRHRDDRGARRRRAPGGAQGQGHGAEGQGRRERVGHVVARAGRGAGEHDGEDAGRHHAHRRGGADVARAAAGDLEEADPAVRRLPAGGDGRRGRAGGTLPPSASDPDARPRDPPPRPPPSRSVGSASGCPRSGRRSWGSSGGSSAGARRPDRRQPAACAFIRSSSFLVVRRFLIVSSP